MITRSVKLTSNGDGTGRLEIVIDGVRVMERRPGIYDIARVDEVLPQKLRCDDEELRPNVVVRCYCKSARPRRYMKLARAQRLKRIKALHGS